MGFLSCIYYYIALSSAKLNETLCSKFWLTFTNIIATVFCAEIYLTYNSMRSIIVSATHGEEHYSRWLGAIAALIVFMAKLLYKSEGEKNIIKFFYHKISCSKDQAVIICGVKEFQQQNPGQPYPVSVALGADPATILGAVTPVPDNLSEFAFAGLLRGNKTEVVKSLSNDLLVPASAEYVLEGYIAADDMADIRAR